MRKRQIALLIEMDYPLAADDSILAGRCAYLPEEDDLIPDPTHFCRRCRISRALKTTCNKARLRKLKRAFAILRLRQGIPLSLTGNI